MNRVEYLLTKLAEECVEVAHRCHKAQCFGLDDIGEKQTATNVELINHELNDLFAIVEMLDNEEFLNLKWNDEAIEKKKDKVRKWMQYSIRNGCLQL